MQLNVINMEKRFNILIEYYKEMDNYVQKCRVKFLSQSYFAIPAKKYLEENFKQRIELCFVNDLCIFLTYLPRNNETKWRAKIRVNCILKYFCQKKTLITKCSNDI